MKIINSSEIFNAICDKIGGCEEVMFDIYNLVLCSECILGRIIENPDVKEVEEINSLYIIICLLRKYCRGCLDSEIMVDKKT